MHTATHSVSFFPQALTQVTSVIPDCSPLCNDGRTQLVLFLRAPATVQGLKGNVLLPSKALRSLHQTLSERA